jgi:hypothetical protein
VGVVERFDWNGRSVDGVIQSVRALAAVAVFAFCLAPAAAMASNSGSSGSAPSVTRTVPCDETIGGTPFPYLGSISPRERYRLVLGAVSVPPAVMEQVVPTNEKPWTYWRKAGLVIGGRARVSVSVPKLWRNRVAITWGNLPGTFTSLTFASCNWPNIGHAYAGGFYLRSPAACVPLTFSVGHRSATVRFGVGRRCP